MLSRGWVLYKIGAFSFRNKVKHGVTSIKKAEFMASVAKRIVNIILGTSGNYLLFFLKLLLAFFKIFIYFNWRLITLQYCSGFCHTLT